MKIMDSNPAFFPGDPFPQQFLCCRRLQTVLYVRDLPIHSRHGQAEALAGSGDWLEGKRFSGSVSEAELQSWIEELQ